MSSCSFDELVGGLAEMLRDHAQEDDIKRFLEILSPDYQAEVLAAAHELVADWSTKQ